MSEQSGFEAFVILYVDDDASNRLVFEKSFSGRFRVATAACADEALASLASQPVGVVVTDQRMPGLCGNALLDRVKHLYPDVVRFVITGFGDSEHLLEAVNRGLVARYFIKPWDHEELTHSLEWALDAHRLAKENSALHMRLLETERLATLSIISSGMLHDLNQPLAFMFTNSQRLEQLAAHAIPAAAALLERHGAELTPRQRSWLADLVEELPAIAADMKGGSGTLRGMTEDLGRLLYPRQSAACECRCNPVEVTRYAMSICRQVAMSHDAELVFDLPPELPPVRMRSTELMQTLINLVKNAAEAVGRKSPAGGKIVLDARPKDAQVCFVIRDDGPGMSESVLAKVGRPFFTTRGDGTGLGVAQCKRLVNAAGGELEIDSVEGTGTTIRFSVPVV